jgi:hypothetical protein
MARTLLTAGLVTILALTTLFIGGHAVPAAESAAASSASWPAASGACSLSRPGPLPALDEQEEHQLQEASGVHEPSFCFTLSRHHYNS